MYFPFGGSFNQLVDDIHIKVDEPTWPKNRRTRNGLLWLVMGSGYTIFIGCLTGIIIIANQVESHENDSAIRVWGLALLGLALITVIAMLGLCLVWIPSRLNQASNLMEDSIMKDNHAAIEAALERASQEQFKLIDLKVTADQSAMITIELPNGEQKSATIERSSYSKVNSPTCSIKFSHPVVLEPMISARYGMGMLMGPRINYGTEIVIAVPDFNDPTTYPRLPEPALPLA